MRNRILVLDDNDALCELLLQAFGKRGFEVHVASTGAEALQIVASHRIDAAITDLEIPGFSGLEFCRALTRQFRHFQREIPVWLMTGVDLPELEADALAAGARGVFRKPFNLEDATEQIVSVLSEKYGDARREPDSPATCGITTH